MESGVVKDRGIDKALPGDEAQFMLAVYQRIRVFDRRSADGDGPRKAGIGEEIREGRGGDEESAIEKKDREVPESWNEPGTERRTVMLIISISYGGSAWESNPVGLRSLFMVLLP